MTLFVSVSIEIWQSAYAPGYGYHLHIDWIWEHGMNHSKRLAKNSELKGAESGNPDTNLQRESTKLSAYLS